jgi:signal transduction histidine kinase
LIPDPPASARSEARSSEPARSAVHWEGFAHLAGLVCSPERLDDVLNGLAAEFPGVTVVDLMAVLRQPLGAGDTGVGAAPAHEEDVSAFLTTFAERLSCAVIEAEPDRAAPSVASGRRVVGDQQAALLRIAVAVARGVDPREVVGLIAREVGVLSGASRVRAFRSGVRGVREPIAEWPEDTVVGGSHEVSRFDVEIRRVDEGIRGELVLRVASDRPLSKAFETLVREFLELASLGVKNADAREALSASRARLLQAGDEERRLIERALQEGPQRRLQGVGTELTLATEQLSLDRDQATASVTRAQAALDAGMTQLQILARGIHPVLLTERGLDTALADLVSESRARATLRSTVGRRVGSAVELAAYYIVAGALDYLSSRVGATETVVEVAIDGSGLAIDVSDEGVGAKRTDHESGLVKLQDRAAALGGELRVDGGARSGLTIRARIPLGDDAGSRPIPGAGAIAGVRDVDLGFDAIAAEAGRLAGAKTVSIARMDRNSNLILGSWQFVGEPPAHIRVPLAEAPLACRAFVTGYAARRVGDRTSTVCLPVLAGGQPWGFITMVGDRASLAEDGERAIAELSGGLARAIAHDAEQRALHGTRDPAVSDQTAALLRVATLVARSRGSQEVFETIAEEVGRALSAQTANVIRFDPEGMVTIMSGWNAPGHVRFADGGHFPVSASLGTMMLIERGQAIGIDDADPARTFVPEVAARMKTNAVGYLPLFVRGQLWGEVIAAAVDGPVLKPELERFIGSLLELVAISIDNAQTQADLTASRSRLVWAADSARRRIERDLHDGAQSRFVSLAVKLQLVQIMLERESNESAALLQDAVETLDAGLRQLSQLTRGIHPSLLRDVGLAGALRDLVENSGVAATLNVAVHCWLDDRIEVAAYYVVAEALTNVAKHARARSTTITVNADASLVTIVVRDDGRGGASADAGTGLGGLTDRVQALGGQLTLESDAGRGTTIMVTLPCAPVQRSEPELVR